MTGTTIHAELLADHEELEHRIAELIAAFATGDRDAAASAFASFEKRLNEHIAMEENVLFPELQEVQPEETEALRAEHRDICSRLEELGIGVQLHQTRLPAIEELAVVLRRHAAREDAGLYRWADQVFSDPAHRARLPSTFTHPRPPAPPVV